MAIGTSQAAEVEASKGNSGAKTGLKIPRYFTRPGTHPYDEIEWELRNASITNEKGKVVFEQTNVEMPKSWWLMARRAACRCACGWSRSIFADPLGRRSESIVYGR